MLKLKAKELSHDYMIAIGHIHRNCPPLIRAKIELREWLKWKYNLYKLYDKPLLAAICEAKLETL